MAQNSTAQEFARLAELAAANEIALAEGVAERCAQLCDDYAEQLIDLRNRTRTIMHVDSFGALRSARELGAKFEQLAIGGPGSGSFAAALEEHIGVVEAMADMFRKAGAAYRATESGNATDISSST
ncbi:hypothetical protein [Nocardia harenae]|uniref:hypothetical protein n=1 Tax=Nocardia harenae TaxID=358707 RepID=UPI000830BAE9|nr:hypothetical protein [Nocardia harenae]